MNLVVKLKCEYSVTRGDERLTSLEKKIIALNHRRLKWPHYRGVSGGTRTEEAKKESMHRLISTSKK